MRPRITLFLVAAIAMALIFGMLIFSLLPGREVAVQNSSLEYSRSSQISLDTSAHYQLNKDPQSRASTRTSQSETVELLELSKVNQNDLRLEQYHPMRVNNNNNPLLTSDRNRRMRYPSCNSELPDDTFTTCKGKSLGAGYILALHNWEQVTAGSANFVSLQCWAATMNMVVVEPITDRNAWYIPYQMLDKPNKTTEVRGTTLSEIFDFDYWNLWSKEKCFSPIVKWKDFLCHAPRNVILVHVTYSTYNNKGDVVKCLPDELNERKQTISAFFDTHEFDIIQQVCIHQQTLQLSQEEFNKYIIGNDSGIPVVVVMDMWRGAESGGSDRVGIRGTQCGRGEYLSLPYAKPSKRMKKEIKVIQEQLLHNQEYIAVMVRNEYAVQSLVHRPRDSWSYDACLAGVVSAWKELKASHPELKETFWSFDASKYGTTLLNKQARLEYNAFMIKHMNMSYFDFEDTLVELGGVPVGAYIAALEQHVSAQAKCLLTVGGGSFQAHARDLYREYHRDESPCLTQYGSFWHVEQCSVKHP